VKFQPQHNRWQCSNRHPRRQFTLKTGTIMEDSPLGLDKWLPAMWLVASNRNGISSWELHRALGVTQKTAWFLLHRVRLAMQDDLTCGSLGGEVEVDETFIGGKARNMHKERKERADMRKGGGGKTIVMGMLERGGKVRASAIPDRTKVSMQPIIRGSVEPGTTIYSDEHGYNWTMAEFEHCDGEPLSEIRGWQRTHQRHGEFLELVEADHRRNLRFGRTFPSVPVRG
jgi:hypothetical protein